jgi:hypothetical protein
MMNYGKALLREPSNKIFLDRRKKILAHNTCIEDDGFITAKSWINESN